MKGREATSASASIHLAMGWSCHWNQTAQKSYGGSPLCLSLRTEFSETPGQDFLSSRQPWDGHCPSLLWGRSLSSAL